MNSGDFKYFLTFFMLLVPYGLIWFIVFRIIKEDLRTVLSYTFFTLLSFLGFSIYNSLIMGFATTLNERLQSLIIATSYVAILFSNIMIIPALVMTLTYFIKLKL